MWPQICLWQAPRVGSLRSLDIHSLGRHVQSEGSMKTEDTPRGTSVFGSQVIVFQSPTDQSITAGGSRPPSRGPRMDANALMALWPPYLAYIASYRDRV